MRDVDHIWAAWLSGQYIGDYKPCSRATVEIPYSLRTTGNIVGQWKKGPARWFQRADLTDQVETELPNLESVTITRGFDADAGSLDLVMANIAPQAFGQPPPLEGQFGEPGYYTWDHGVAPEARSRWGQTQNAWSNVIVPNALIRVYQGFGGHDKDLDDAVTDGNLVLNGVFLVDDVNITSDGSIHLKCRDMAKLLIDQQIFPPLVPAGDYPLKYMRYTYQGFQVPADPPPSSAPHSYAQGSFYSSGNDFSVTSSSDQYYGGLNASVNGHRPADMLDWEEPTHSHYIRENDETYWLSEPHGAATGFAWNEFRLDSSQEDAFSTGLVNQIHVHPWGGNYQVFISIWENGAWVAPEAGGQGGIIDSGDPMTAIPYVMAGGTAWEVATSINLERTYNASKIRVTFTNLLVAPEGGFRVGMRKVVGVNNFTDDVHAVFSFTAAAYPYNTDNLTGYWQARSNGHIYAFGDARIHQATDSRVHGRPLVAMCAHTTGQGYWTMDTSGQVIAYGDATVLDGSTLGLNDCVDFAITPSGNGCWLLHANGIVEVLGDAVFQGQSLRTFNMPSGAVGQARSIEGHPVDMGYRVLWSDGQVDAFNLPGLGSANRSGFKLTEYVSSIRNTHTGNGYWITSGQGIVQNFGDAPALGNATAYPEEMWVDGLCWDLIPYSENDNGYAVQYADGNLAPRGTFQFFGSVGTGTGQLRKDGNYKDYTDIVRDLLLWAGFYLFQDPQLGAEFPKVYGNLENTGAFAKDDLPQDMFDKKTVFDCIRSLKEIVGYLFWVDEEGAVRFESPNWWTMGNFNSAGQPVNLMPEIDEEVNLIDYGISFNDTNARSEIIIATQSPYPSINGATPPKGVLQTRVIPAGAADLKGMVRPAMWTNGLFIEEEDQKVMADLISMHIWFARRTSQITCTANPLIGINDQVRIFERTTGEVYVHYVRAVTISHNIKSGDFTMSLTTHWMGGAPYSGDDDPLSPDRPWAIVSATAYDRLGDPTSYVAVSAAVESFLSRTGSPSANNAAALHFGDPEPATTKASS